ncbi:MAG: SUMF1/EgtB/PvdO family nonheme iron enzyme, partial [Myxococcota bacterium]|nr:SUMF1/EgtB/PvdO family nonheme iron enzyme [Myxococcota bacterium]
ALWTENGGGEIPSGMGGSGGCPPNNTDDLILSDGTDLASLAWFCVNGNDQVHPVGQLAPNGFGLYDMGGNVREWMNDWYANTEPGAVTDPVGDGVGNGNKIRRGGSFADHSRRVRPASRLHSDPERRANMIGFRLVRTALEE